MTRRRRSIAAGLLVAAAVAAVIAVAFVTVGPLRAPAGPDVPRFVDETGSAGIATTYEGEQIYATGGGLAVLDCNEDGRPDLFVAGGANPAALYRNESVPGGALRFASVPSPVTDRAGVTGAYPLDIDGDGHADLAVLRVDGVQLLRGDGRCGFADAGAGLGFDGGTGWTTAFSATWEGENALPTLALGRYLVRDASGAETFDCDTNALVRPAGVAARTYAAPVTLSPGWCSLSMLFSDWDGSGRRDLRVSNDRQYYVDGQEQLWRIAPSEAPRAYTAADGWRPVQIWGMGIASYDLTGDGHPEIYLTSQGDNRLQTLAAGPSRPTYADIALQAGVTAAQPYAGGESLPSTAWHPEFQDVNDDGLVDLFVSKGNVNAMPDYASKDPSNLLLGRPDGTFVESGEAAGIVSYDRGRGAAVADLNLDGLPDLVVVNYGTPVMAWRNVGGGSAPAPAPMGGWLELRLHDPGPNRDGIGAIVEARIGGSAGAVKRLEVTVGGGHGSGQLGWIHVGLGAARDAEIRVRWPDGQQGEWMPVAADQFLDVTRGVPAPVPWSPSPS